MLKIKDERDKQNERHPGDVPSGASWNAGQSRKSDSRTGFAKRRLRSRLLFMLFLGLSAIYCESEIRDTALLAAARLHQPIILTNDMEHLPAPAWKAIPLNLPSDGTMKIEVNVVKGNPIDVFLIKPNQLDNTVKAEKGNRKQSISGIVSALETKTLRRIVPAKQGAYYLVVCDMSIDTIPAPTSSISVKVQLNP
jgi:hypothetical protein